MLIFIWQDTLNAKWFNIHSGAVITRSTITWCFIQHRIGPDMSQFVLTKYIPYPALIGEIWGVVVRIFNCVITAPHCTELNCCCNYHMTKTWWNTMEGGMTATTLTTRCWSWPKLHDIGFFLCPLFVIKSLYIDIAVWKINQPECRVIAVLHSMSHEAYTQFCCVLHCFGISSRRYGFRWFI